MTAGASSFAGFLGPADPRWKAYLCKARHDFFHLPGYLEACASHEGGDPLLFCLEVGNQGMLVPLIKRSLSDFGPRFSDYSDASSPYGYPCPIYWGDSWQEHLPGMHLVFESMLQEHKVVSLFLRLNPFLGASDTQLATLGEVKSHGPTVYFDLRDSERSWQGINEANRTFIKRMLKRGCRVAIDAWDTMDTVIDAYYETMQRLSASPYYFFPRAFFKGLKETTASHLHLGTCFAPTGEISGGVFFTEVDGLIQYYLMGSFEAFSEYSPSKLLINALRLWGLEHGHHTLHLGGGLGAQKDGLFEFKSRFSKSFAQFSTYRRVLLPEVYEALVRESGDASGGYFPAYRANRR